MKTKSQAYGPIVSILVLFMLFMMCTATAAWASEVEPDVDLTVKVPSDKIVDGTADFDEDDKPGNDSGPNNGIVRSFDTITYPLQIVVNDKSGGNLSNIKVKINAELENSVTDKFVNAQFVQSAGETIGVKDDMAFMETTYMIDASGSAVTFPVNVNVSGAENGLKLRPHFSITVLEVDGQKLAKPVTQKINNVQYTQVSSEVSIKVKSTKSLYNGYPLELEAFGNVAKSIENSGDFVGQAQYSIMAVPRPGKTSVKGSALPRGQLNYKINAKKTVSWDATGETETVDDDDEPRGGLQVLDILPLEMYFPGSNERVSKKKFTMSHDQNLSFKPRWLASSYHHAYSSSDDGDINHVKESGDWQLNKKSDANSVEGQISGYIPGGVFPTIGSYTKEKNPRYDINEKAFATQQFLFYIKNDYGFNGKHNKGKKNNTLAQRIEFDLVSYTDKDGVTHPINSKTVTDISIRNLMPGTSSTSVAWFDFKRGHVYNRPEHTWAVAFGEGTTTPGDRSMGIKTRSSHTRSEFGRFNIATWNTDFAQMTKSDAEKTIQRTKNDYYISNQRMLVGDNPENEILFGVLKGDIDNSAEGIMARRNADFTWYDSYDEAIKAGTISGMKLSTHDLVLIGLASSTHLTMIDTTLGELTAKGTPKLAVSLSGDYKDETRKTYNEGTNGNQTIGNITEYDKVTNELVRLQNLQGSVVRFDTLGLQGLIYRNEIFSNKPSFYSTDTVEWSISNSLRTPESGFEKDESARTQVTLDPGLVYVPNSGTYGSDKNEPTVTKNEDGSSTLEFKHTTTAKDLIKPIRFKTTFFDKLINYNTGGTASLSAKTVVMSDLDGSIEKARTDKKEVIVSRVGKVSIAETIDKAVEDINQDFTVTLTPYTTITAEDGFKGLIELPQNGSALKTKFNGSYSIKSVELKGDNSGKFWYTNKVLTDFNPNTLKLDDSWSELTSSSKLTSDNAKFIYFELDKPLTNQSDVSIEMAFKAYNNLAGDIYEIQSFGNSKTNYSKPVSSNIVTHTIIERSLSGKAWFDSNGNGLIDKDEVPVADVPIKLYKQSGSDLTHVTQNIKGETISDLKTNKDGDYSVRYLPAGQYLVSFDISHIPHVQVTQKNASTDETLTSKVNIKPHPGKEFSTDTIVMPATKDLTEPYKVSHRNLGIKPDTFDLGVTKEWVGVPGSIQHKPVDAVLYQDGKEYKKLELSQQSWVKEFTNIPYYSKDGKLHKYEIKEGRKPDGYENDISMEDDAATISNIFSDISTTYKVTKKWENVDMNANLPAIDVELYADGKPTGKKLTLNKANNFKDMFNDLQAYSYEGNLIKYSAKELNVPAGYETKIEGDEYESVITNTYKPELIAAEVTKQWDTTEALDSLYAEFELLRNGEKTGKVVKTDKSNQFTAKVDKLPKTDQMGRSIQYSFSENMTNYQGYMTEVVSREWDKSGNMSMVVKNTYAPDKTSVTVDKIWDIVSTQHGSIDDIHQSIDVELTGVDTVTNENVITETATLTKDNGYIHSFTDLPLVSKSDNSVKYSVKETSSIQDYESSIDQVNETYYTITNAFNPMTKPVHLIKKWVDAEGEDITIDHDVTVTLTPSSDLLQPITVTLSKHNNYSAVVNVPLNDVANNVVTYSVKEDNIPAGYDVTIDGVNDGQLEDEIVVTNTYNPELTSVRVDKEWVDAAETGLPEVEVHLLQNGHIIDTAIMSEESSWSHEFTNLPSTDTAGNDYTYTIEETQVSGFESEVAELEHNHFLVTNSYAPELIDLQVNKLWLLDDDIPVKTPSIMVELTANGEHHTQLKLDKESDYTATIKDLPKHDNAGNVIHYGFTELSEFDEFVNETPGIVDADENTPANLINRHTPKPPEIEAIKPDKPDKPSAPVKEVIDKVVEKVQTQFAKTGTSSNALNITLGITVILASVSYLGYVAYKKRK